MGELSALLCPDVFPAYGPRASHSPVVGLLYESPPCAIFWALNLFSRMRFFSNIILKSW